MNKQAPLVSRPQKHGTAVFTATWRTLKSELGVAISSHGEVLDILIFLLRGVIRISHHLLDPDLIHNDFDGR